MPHDVRRRLMALAAAISVLTGCAGSPAAVADPARVTRTSTPTPDVNPIVGRWMQVHTCDQLVRGLEEFGLGAIAPAMVGDYFPDVPADELASKEDLCAGATPQRHFHFFDDAGMFGSLDQHEQQVDDGTYLIDGGVLRIGEGAWRIAIEGNDLSFEPLITQAQRRRALARPLEWSTAGWVVAVAYPGTTWRRVPCNGWC